MHRSCFSPAACAAGLLLALGCSSNTELFGNPSGGAGGATTTTTANGGSGALGGGTTSSGGAGGAGANGGQGGAGGEPCTPEPVGVKLPPLDLVVMVDRSGSSVQNGKLDLEKSTLSAFAGEPRAPGTSVALVYHPGSGVADTCPVSLYYPPALPLTPIPSGAATVDGSLAAQSPAGPSPWQPVLQGALQYATEQKNQQQSHAVAAVFLVDTPANVCGQDVSAMAAMASAALNTERVLTFTVGLEGAPLPSLDQIAAAGGTGQAYDLTAPGATSALQDVMNEIRSRALPCGYRIPDPPTGPFDAELVNLQYAPGGNGSPDTIGQVGGEGQCGDGPGWYYDDPNDPTAIMLCPALCHAIQQDVAPQVEVVFGCPTVEA